MGQALAGEWRVRPSEPLPTRAPIATPPCHRCGRRVSRYNLPEGGERATCHACRQALAELDRLLEERRAAGLYLADGVDEPLVPHEPAKYLSGGPATAQTSVPAFTSHTRTCPDPGSVLA